MRKAVNLNQRLDIQGLRALAVLSVIIFHAGLELPGGFLGVDIFFVISGFVITGSLIKARQNKLMPNFLNFYQKRVLRLTPALSLMTVFTLVCGVVILSPFGALQNLGKTATGASLFVSNFVISRITGGYFGAVAETNPLLHTWSLSVEEQFYFVFPAILGVFFWIQLKYKYKNGWLFFLVVLIIPSLSFASLISLDLIQETGFWRSFYSPITRIWEFGFGVSLAMWMSQQNATVKLKTSDKTNNVLGIVGFSLIILSLATHSEDNSLPGPHTLIPILGTCLIIFAGSSGSGLITKVLSIPLLVKIGDLSYSLYLWHWPFIVYAAIIWPGNFFAIISAAIVSFIPALLSYRFIEKPVRVWRPASNWTFLKAAAFFVLVPVIVSISVISFADFRQNSLTSTQNVNGGLRGDIGHDSIHSLIDNQYFPCTPTYIYTNAESWGNHIRCNQSIQNKPIELLLFGDSHAEQLFIGTAEAFPEINVGYYILSQSPIRGNEKIDKIITEIISSDSIKVVIVNSAWSSRGVPEIELQRVLSEISNSGKVIYLLDDNPVFGFDPYDCKYNQGLFLPGRCEEKNNGFINAYESYAPKLEKAIRNTNNAWFLKTNDFFCDNKFCSMENDGAILFRDQNHLNIEGSSLYMSKLFAKYPEVYEQICATFSKCSTGANQ